MRRNGIQFGKLSFFIICFVHIFDMYEFLTMIFFLHRITSQRFTSFHIRDGCVSKICGLCRQERVCLYFKELKNTRSQIYQILIFCVITEQNNFCQSYLQSICNSENQRPASTTGASVHRSPRSTGAPPSQVHVQTFFSLFSVKLENYMFMLTLSVPLSFPNLFFFRLTIFNMGSDFSFAKPQALKT